MGEYHPTCCFRRLGRDLRPCATERLAEGGRIRGSAPDVLEFSASSRWMCEKNKIGRAHKIDKAGGGTSEAKWACSQRSEYVLDCQLRRFLDAGVMTPKRVKPVRVGRGDQRLAKARRHFFGLTIWIEQAFVKMAELN